MHHGRSKDGRLLNPTFPYTSFTQVTRADSDALYAYLQTVPPIKQTNLPHALRWPYGTQAALALWRAMYFAPGVYQGEAVRSADWNRGAYLVGGLGHCGACHTPRNVLGATNDKLPLTGGKIPMQKWYAPSLRSNLEGGVADWSAQHVVALLQTGVSPSGYAAGPMAEVVLNSTQYLSSSDLNAMTVYLQSLATPTTTNQVKASIQRTEQGRQNDALMLIAGGGAKLYEAHCVECHGDQGEGVRGAYPSLARNRAVTVTDTSNLVQVVLYGGYAPATAGNPRPFGMPPFVLQLNDKNTAAVLTYIRNAWGNSAPAVTELEVNRARDPQAR